jgi:hypothetical protein
MKKILAVLSVGVVLFTSFKPLPKEENVRCVANLYIVQRFSCGDYYNFVGHDPGNCAGTVILEIIGRYDDPCIHDHED